MSVQIRNLTRRPVTLALNSRTALHLPPLGTSPAIPDGEIQANAKVEKLSASGVVSVGRAGAGAPAGEDETGGDPEGEAKQTTRARSTRPRR